MSVYDQARDTLPEDLYSAYRLLDRIIAANPSVTQKAVLGLRSVDQANCRELIGDKAICALAADLPDVQLSDSFLIWAIQVSSATNGRPNAFATSYNNRIIINRALEQSFDGSFPAKACVIAHELAHIQKDHMKAMKESLQDWNNEAAVKIAAATGNARKAQSSSNFWNAVAMVANSVNAGLNSSVGNYALANAAAFNNQMLARQVAADSAQGQLMVNQIMQSAQQAAPQIYQALAGLEGLSGRIVQRTMKDVRVYLGEVNAKAGGLSRQHEYEADQMAVAYLANAAIDPKGCLDMVALLHRGNYRPVAQTTDSHPGETERKANIEAAIAAYESNYRTAVARSTPNPALAYRYDDRQQLVTVYPRSVVPASASAPFTVDRFLSDPDAAKRDRPSRRTTPAPAPRQPQGAAVQAGQRSTGQNLSDNQDWQQQKEAAAKRYAEMQEWMRNRVR